MIQDSRMLAGARAMAVASAHEVGRGAHLTDISQGRDPRLRAALERLGVNLPSVASADLISELHDDTRIIEVKGRGTRGPVSVFERELDTFVAAGPLSWMYVVWNVTGTGPYGLVLIQDPQRLSWVQTRPAERPAGVARGTRHEAQFECSMEDIEEGGLTADLSTLALPEK